MKTEKKLTVFSMAALILLAVTGYSQEKLITKTKTIEKEYSETIKNIDIWNAFGNIEISYWDKPALKVVVTIKVLAWEQDDAARFIEKISPELKMEKLQTAGYAFTSITDISNIKNLCKCDGNEGKVYAPWFKKNAKVKRFSIDYEVKIPNSVNSIYLNNNFGNVSLPDFKGNLNINLRNGDFKSGKLILTNSADDRIFLRYGRATIKSLENGNIVLYSCKDITTGTLKNITLKSSFSEITIDKAVNLKLNSKNDDISIQDVESLSGEGNFSDLHIANLIKSLTFNNKSGTIKIENIESGFETLSLEGQYNDYILNLNNLDYTLTADLEFTDLESPDNILPAEKRKELIRGAATFEKKVGSNAEKSIINLKCSNCNVKFK